VLQFSLPDGHRVTVEVRSLLNGGFAGRSQHDVAEHVAELVAMGLPGAAVRRGLRAARPHVG
jgi:hypothetical protein